MVCGIMRMQKHGKQYVSYSLNVVGLSVNVSVARSEMERVHRPLLSRMMDAAGSTHSGRYIVLLAGPSGSGKSVLAALWEKVAYEINPDFPFQVLSEDAFHYPNSYLDSHNAYRNGNMVSLRSIKGAPQTYDLEALVKSLRDLRDGTADMFWPRYDRQIHDPIPNAINVNGHGLFVVEGHFLLLDMPGWRDLKPLAAESIFIDIPELVARQDVINRHMQGGKSEVEAEAHYERSDSVNNALIRSRRIPLGEHDTVLMVGPSRDITIQG